MPEIADIFNVNVQLTRVTHDPTPADSATYYPGKIAVINHAHVIWIRKTDPIKDVNLAHYAPSLVFLTDNTIYAVKGEVAEIVQLFNKAATQPAAKPAFLILQQVFQDYSASTIEDHFIYEEFGVAGQQISQLYLIDPHQPVALGAKTLIELGNGEKIFVRETAAVINAQLDDPRPVVPVARLNPSVT